MVHGSKHIYIYIYIMGGRHSWFFQCETTWRSHYSEITHEWITVKGLDIIINALVAQEISGHRIRRVISFQNLVHVCVCEGGLADLLYWYINLEIVHEWIMVKGSVEIFNAVSWPLAQEIPDHWVQEVRGIISSLNKVQCISWGWYYF